MISISGRTVASQLIVHCALVLLAALGASLRAQEPTAAEERDTASLITLQTDNTSVVQVLQILAQRSGLNIVTGPGAEERTISIRLQNTPFEEALNLVCRASGLGYERIGGSIIVADMQRLGEPTGLTSRVIDLQYADVQQVRKALEVLTTAVGADVRSNRLVLFAPQSAIEHAERAVRLLDRKPGQVLFEARLVEVNTSRLQELGIDWEKITKWNGLLVEGDPGSSPPDALPRELGFVELGEGMKPHRQVETLELAIDALITNGAARVLSDSKVVTVDGEPAEIFAGETVPVVITSLQQPGGGGGVLQTVQLEKIDVGVRLNITPRLSDDGFITTLVEPEVSRIVAFVGPDDDLPQTSTRRARTIVRVRDGQKIYLGGLLTEEARRTVKKVPILGHLPLIGYIFQHHRDEKVRLDLVIEITPRIVGDEGDALPRSELVQPDAMQGDGAGRGPAPEERPDRSPDEGSE